MTGKTGESVRRRENGRPVWDAVVMDAPPTGRITRFLNVNSEVGSLTRVGPIKNQADSVMRVIRSPETMVHLVTLLEEMPVQETIDGIAELSDEQLSRDVPVSVAQLSSGLAAAGLPSSGSLVEALEEEGVDHAIRVRLQRRERERLESLGVPIVGLPLLDGIDLGGLYELAESIVAQAPR